MHQILASAVTPPPPSGFPLDTTAPMDRDGFITPPGYGGGGGGGGSPSPAPSGPTHSPTPTPIHSGTAAPTTSPVRGTLPVTGPHHLALLVVGALVFIVVGGILVFAARRRARCAG